MSLINRGALFKVFDKFQNFDLLKYGLHKKEVKIY